MNSEIYINKIIRGDCRENIPNLEDTSIHLMVSDIPYGINAAEWDVMHSNSNSALLGSSPGQTGKTAFKRRNKPINGWSKADRHIGQEYEMWCMSWTDMLFPKMIAGSSLFVFCGRRTMHHVVNAFERSGFLLKDILTWKKSAAHQRAQRLSVIYENRGMTESAEKWEGWRVGNLAPICEPIAWFAKPYRIGGTIADNVLEHGVGGVNFQEFAVREIKPENILEFSFSKDEKRIHETQKPVELVKFLIELTTKPGHTVIDPFMGSGTTAEACVTTDRNYIGFEMDEAFHRLAIDRLNVQYDSSVA